MNEKKLSAKLKDDILYYFNAAPNRSEIERKINDVPAIVAALTRYVDNGKGIQKSEATKLINRISSEIDNLTRVKKNPGPGPKRRPKQLGYGDNIFFRTRDGFGPGEVINPHYNIADYSYTQGGREYDKNGHRHIRQVEILTSRGKPKIVHEFEIDGMPEAPAPGNPRVKKNPSLRVSPNQPLKFYAERYTGRKIGGGFMSRVGAQVVCENADTGARVYFWGKSPTWKLECGAAHGVTGPSKATENCLKSALKKCEIYADELNKEHSQKRAIKKNPIIPGITARPVTGKRKPVFAVEYAKAKTGPWTTAGIFPNRTLADDYCKSMHDQNGGKWWRVVLK